MNVLEAEKKVGIETFYTNFKGVSGKLRTTPHDFIVKEIFSYPKKEKGKFTIAEVESVNWETNRLVRDLSNRLHISRQRINFAGTKDKRAKTTQLLSFYKVDIEDLKKIKLKDVEIKNIYKSNKPVKIGNLKGNKFEINIKDIRKDITKKDIEYIGQVFEEKKGFPNFFGIQRFGVIRPITHIVGKHLVKGEIKKAVMTYIANPTKDEDKNCYELRKKLEETHDYSYALKNYPDKLNYEKAILNKLVEDPEDYVSALKALPKNLLTMFVYAYQSYLFNKILSKRIEKKIPIDKAIVGDIILPVRNNEISNEEIIVKEYNKDKINKQIAKNKAYVSGVLIGSDSFLSEGEMGKIERNIIEKEKIDPRDFIIPEIPFISSSGLRRPIFTKLENFKIKLIEENKDISQKIVNVKFNLKKGCYATSLLREIMKTDNIRNY